MIGKAGIKTLVVAFTTLIVAVPIVWAADAQEIAAQAVLETIKAVRTVYSKQIIEQVKKAGVKPSEKWQGRPAADLQVQHAQDAGGNRRAEKAGGEPGSADSDVLGRQSGQGSGSGLCGHERLRRLPQRAPG